MPSQYDDFIARKLREINEGSPLRGELPGGTGMPIGSFRPTGALAGRAAPAGNPRYPTRPVNASAAPRPAPAQTGAYQPLPPRFTPGQPGYTPGQFSTRSSAPPLSTPSTPGPSINYTAALSPGLIALGGYGVHQAGQALRERRGDEAEPETPFPQIPIPEGPTRSPEDVLRETVERERAARTAPYSIYGEDTPRERLGTDIPRLAASVMRRGEPSGSRVAPAEPSGSGVPSAAPAKGDWWSKIFGGPQQQGSGGQLLQRSGDGRTTVNWGDRDSAADFFRADQAMRKLQAEKQDFEGRSGSDIDYVNRMAASQQNAKAVPEGKAKGGSVDTKPTKEAMLHKALEIIHHMIANK